MLDKQIAHLGFIQGVINRMGSNSFLLKGWSVTLVAAMFALSGKEANTLFALLTYFPIIMFWYLDAYFLHQERLFRKLYEGVAKGEIPSDTFTLNTAVVRKDVASFYRVMVSPTLLGFHGPIFVIVLLVMLAIKSC